MTIIGIPTTRVSDLFVRRRLTNQAQADQLDLYRIHTQLSTGRRFQLPSEDANAAVRVMSLQRLLEQREQIGRNLDINQSYMTASDTALSAFSDALTEARGLALGAIGDQATDIERSAASQQLGQILNQLLDAGNQEFRGRHLFAGRDTSVLPFAISETGMIRYDGDEGRLASYSDVDLLFDTNVNGSEAFGVISDPAEGTVDLNPILTADTRLADLRAGRGISDGSITITVDGITSTIDLSAAETIGDVATLIRANPPIAKPLNVEITATGLMIELSAPAPGDSLVVMETGGGTTADELGILAETPVVGPLVGTDLDPLLKLTTPVGDLLGTRASVVARSLGTDNDIIFETGVVGTTITTGPFAGVATNGIDVIFDDDGTVLTPGMDEIAQWIGPNTLRVTVRTGFTSASRVVDVVNAAFNAVPPTVPIRARLDPIDARNGGMGIVDATPPAAVAGTTAGGTGTAWDQSSGLLIVNGNSTTTVSFAGAQSVQDVLNTLNLSEAGVLAQINSDGTGINVRSRISGADFMIGENGGTTAADLGLRTFNNAVRLQDLNFQLGIQAETGTDFTIARTDGVTVNVDVSAAQTVDDVLIAINAVSGGTYTAQLAVNGNGIELIDAVPGPQTLTVANSGASSAANWLGLIPEGQQSAQATVVGLTQVLTGRDVNPMETESVFTALVRLRTALEANDMVEATRAMALLSQSTLDLNFTRAELGARQQNVDVMQQRLETEEIDLRSILSEDLDADLVEVASEMTARQLSFEAALRSTASILQMTLLNYL
ncbi:MAG: hypothetical protein HQ567_34870 [Candidatus Nealsonbacteria bacterium]|nr:hypothetical protein [Candidatus Nealsonbacteria bacterium]